MNVRDGEIAAAAVTWRRGSSAGVIGPRHRRTMEVAAARTK
jgi:hypothetical protein